jgi:hypothetical protein
VRLPLAVPLFPLRVCECGDETHHVNGVLMGPHPPPRPIPADLYDDDS